MFGNLFKTAIGVVKSFLSGNKATPKPAPAPKMAIPKPVVRPADSFAKLAAPAAFSPYIAKWGDSRATIQAGMARNDAAEVQRQAEAKRQAEEIARAAAAKRKFEAEQKFNKTKATFAQQAANTVEQLKKNQKGDIWGKLTGGFATENRARTFAEQRLKELEQTQGARYDAKLNSFLAEQTKRRAEIEKKRFSTKAEFDQAVGIFSKWEQEQLDDLNFMAASSDGLKQGYGDKSQEAGRSAIARAGGWFNKNVVDPVAANPFFKYTLGSGDENVPSVVTAPSRVVNWVGNMFNKDGTKNLYDKKTVQGLEAGKNAWTQTFNQRNFNMQQPKQASAQGFEQWFATRDLSGWKGVDKNKVKDLYRQTYEAQLRGDEMANNVTEFFADPLSLFGGSATKGAKALKWSKKALESTQSGAKLFETVNKVAQSKPIQWLGQEYKTPEQQFSEAVRQAKDQTEELHQRLVPRINAINQKLAGDQQIDLSILDDLKGLSDHEAAILQRMVDGKFSLKDKVALRDLPGLRGGTSAQRERLLAIADKWENFTEKMKLSDEIVSTRFGKGKATYSPRLDLTGEHTFDTWNPKAKKKFDTRKRPQSARDLALGAEQRYLKSFVGDDMRAEATAERNKWRARRDELQGEYQREMESLTAGVRSADQKRGTLGRYVRQRRAGEVPTTGLGRSVFNTARNAAGFPMKAWKKSVLTYRPAWTVNNVLYNTQAAALASGPGALVEQARLLRRRNWKQAMNDVPEGVRADLTGELGTSYSGRNPLRKVDSKLNDFYGGVENWSRVAAFRAAKAKGLTDEEALKRVDKYLFSYKTKNWERPLKTVMPFWAWSKNLTKAAATMPFDRPLAAKGYHEVDQYQQGQFDAEFEQLVPQLTEMGYSEEEIQQIKAAQASYYRGRLKIGDKWISTPFNAFSEKGLAGVGFNPFLTAAGESGLAVDSFGQPISGEAATFRRRLISKFPQAELGRKSFAAYRVASGAEKPIKTWIGEPGSAGYGLSKQRQGYDPAAANYDRSMDPRAKLGQDWLAFLGVPRSLEFNKNKLLENKRLQKVTDDYFDLDVRDMDFDQAEAARQAIFAKYKITPEEFYGGILGKYDSDNTKRIKGLKQSAREANKRLFDEYAKQPAGTRNLWAVNKLRELNAAGYFNDNPFKSSFSWINPDGVARADKQALVQEAMATGNWSKYQAKYGKTQKQKDYEYASSTGDWSAWRAKYGTKSQKARDYQEAQASGDWSVWDSKYGRSEKAKARDEAVRTGNWDAYAAKYGVSKKSTPYQHDGKFFKSAESMARYKEAQFWDVYAKADKLERRKLLADNPQYNRRKDWTDTQWDEAKSASKAKQLAELRTVGRFAAAHDRQRESSQANADRFTSRRTRSRVRTRWA